MRSLLDREGIENVIKYYSYVNKGRSFKNGKTNEIDEFKSIDYDFELNYLEWARNKELIFKLFGEKLKVVKDLKDKSVCGHRMTLNLRDEFLEKEGRDFNFLIKGLINCLDPSEISSNVLERNIDFLDVGFKKGWKVTKCFSHLEFDKKKLDHQLDIYSTFLQSLYVKGRLVLSIDPLDFITMSCSKSGWSSCHHPNAEYGTGGVAYMNDSVSIIAYVETEDPMINYVLDKETGKTHKVEMPNKIWRQVITLNSGRDYALQLSEYPNESPVYREEAGNLLIDLMSKMGEAKYIKHKIKYKDDGVSLQGSNDYLPCYIFYCDYQNNNFNSITCLMKEEYENVSILSDSIFNGKVDKIIVGEEVYCACGCGEENYTSSLYTEDCEAGNHLSEY